jgi:hypothetical protein
VLIAAMLVLASPGFVRSQPPGGSPLPPALPPPPAPAVSPFRPAGAEDAGLNLSPEFLARWRRAGEFREQQPLTFVGRLIERKRSRRPSGDREGSSTADLLDYLPPRIGSSRPPGSLFNPGASGPGISVREDEPILGGLLDPRSGWPYVVGFHYQPRPILTKNCWIVATYRNPQVMAPDTWRDLEAAGVSPDAVLERRPINSLLDAMPGRVVVIQVHGSLTYFDAALASGLWAHAWLIFRNAMPADALFVDFDWPSWRVFKSDVRDINEKGRRAYIAGLHLAQFIQTFPPGTRICLIGQSYGGRVVLSALHLLGGGSLDDQAGSPPVRLTHTRPDLHLRAVILGAAADHDWLNPGERLDHALPACEGLLNLYNSKDVALTLYPFLFRSGNRPSIGRHGLSPADYEALGPLASRVSQHDTLDRVGAAHTLLDSIADEQIARWMAPYLWMPGPPVPITGPPGSR